VVVATATEASADMTTAEIEALADPAERLRILSARARSKGTLPPDEAKLRLASMREALGPDHQWTIGALATYLGRSKARLYVLRKQAG
jgi:hypothetical protein